MRGVECVLLRLSVESNTALKLNKIVMIHLFAM